MTHKQVGQTVYMAEEALENYGYQYKNVPLVITHRAHSSMPPEEFYAKGMPDGYHPGYDDGVKGQWLYDLKHKETDIDLPFSLYDWEIQSAKLDSCYL